MEAAQHVEVENELKGLGAEQLRYERAEIGRKLRDIQERIGDLAFNNYRTYADAGRTTQNCTKIFTEMSDRLREVTSDVSSLQSNLRDFNNGSKSLETELAIISSAKDPSSALSEILSLPARIDVCIRSGYYEAAYALTNYGMLMQQHAMVKNPLMKEISDKLVEARSVLLEELFNKFSGSMDLASSLQVVNNVRKMPYLTPTQLRVSILQHKDLYLEKQLLEIASNPDYVLAAIDVYRTCMHDTLVLFLSVFPENETIKKDPNVDPRWEKWPHCAPSCILGQWASKNISRLLELIHRAEMKSGVDMASVWSKMMSVASTLGRMGLDFRPLIVRSLCQLVSERFKAAVRAATSRLVNDIKVLNIANVNLDIATENPTNGAPWPSPELSAWDDICIYGNDIINALNGMRYSHSPMLVPPLMTVLRESFISVLSWLSGFHGSPQFQRPVKILCIHMAPFLSQSIRHLFPFSVVNRLFGSTFTSSQYDAFTELDPRELAAQCDGSEYIEEVLIPILDKKSLVNIDLDALLKKKPQEERDEPIADSNPVGQTNDQSIEPEPLDANISETKPSDILIDDEPEEAIPSDPNELHQVSLE